MAIPIVNTTWLTLSQSDFSAKVNSKTNKYRHVQREAWYIPWIHIEVDSGTQRGFYTKVEGIMYMQKQMEYNLLQI